MESDGKWVRLNPPGFSLHYRQSN